MVWDILLQAAAGILIGAAAGYAFAAIVEALSRAFSYVWEQLVGRIQQIWGYVTEATKYYLALVAQFLDNNWPEIESYLRQEFGYRSKWLLAVFRDGLDVIVVFVDPKRSDMQPVMISLKPLEDQDVQLPTIQNKPIVAVLSN
ncbi:MAG: hypothetical protein O4806_13225 [Trichodesmium sp. St5_bin8]|nr:hypothetical protein [Trichodesmium sp. St5_bin8]